MNRRGFLGSMLAACAAPAIVRADSLMRIAAPEMTILISPLVGAPEFIDLSLSIDEFSRRYIRPAMERLTFALDSDILNRLAERRLP